MNERKNLRPLLAALYIRDEHWAGKWAIQIIGVATMVIPPLCQRWMSSLRELPDWEMELI